MKLSVLRLLTWATLLVLILPSGSMAATQGPVYPGSSATQGDYDHWVYLPLIGKNTSFLPPIIPPTTNPLPLETTAGLLSVSPDGVTYTFDTMTTALTAVAPGEIIVAAPSTAAPNGFLRRVTAIGASGGNVVVQTQPATLEDAIQQGEVVFSRRLTPEGLAAQDLAPGVTLRPASVASPQAAFYLEINDVVIYDDDGNPGTTNDQVLANGSVEFEPTLNFSLLIRQGAIEHLQFTVDARETADLEIEAKLAAAGLKKEKLLGDPIHLQTFVVWVGPVPVVFAPVLTFQIGIDGSVHVGVTTGVTQELTATAGVKYANRTWGPVSGLTNNFTWTPPTLHAGLDLKGYASARLQVLVYGVVGPYGDVGPYLKLEADTAATPWWQLYGGLEVPVGVRVDLLGYKEIASYEVLAIGTKKVLAHGQAASALGYGVQVNSNGNASANIGHIKTLGFGWMKAQMPWKDVEPNPGNYRWDAWDQLISAYHAGGIKILISIVKAPDWARPSNTNFSFEGPPADPATYASFVGQFSGRYCGKVQAIEVWNEQNIFYEWGGEPLDAARYMSLLRSAYLAIKSACPGISVVSGALTPTGAGAPIAVDDVVYLQQMYQAGLRNYCDAVGAHPSGYNNPPDARVGYTNPAEPSFKSHRSFFFRETLEAYRNVMVSFGDANKRIWPTEFGWASATAPVPGYDFARDNTLAEQAQYSVTAYQMAKNWGWIGPMLLWNLDFGVTNPGTELAYWSLLRPDPVPAYAALAAMPK